MAYLKECIEKSGHCTILIDVGPLGPPSAQPDITNTQVAQMAGYDLEELKKNGGRDQVMEKTGAGAARHLLSLIEEDRLAGVIGLGGNQGTAIASMAMKVLPLGFPKFLVSTVASGFYRFVCKNLSGVYGRNEQLKVGNETGFDGITRLRHELAEFSKRSFNRGLISGTGGNISVRIPDTDKILITPSGVSLGDVEAAANILCSLDESVLDSPLDFKPSKETSFHLSIYKLRPDVMAVVHLHPPYATAYANLGSPLLLGTVSSRVKLKMVPCIESALPGSKELRELVSEGIKKYPDIKALLMKEHGILTVGPDLKTAYYLADLVEDTAKIAIITSNIARGTI